MVSQTRRASVTLAYSRVRVIFNSYILGAQFLRRGRSAESVQRYLALKLDLRAPELAAKGKYVLWNEKKFTVNLEVGS